MAGNEQLIDKVVSPITDKQLADLGVRLDETTQKMVVATKQANALNTTLASSKTFGDYTTAAQKAAIATAQVTSEQNKAALTAVQLAKAEAQKEAQQKRATEAAEKQKSAYNQLNKEHIALRQNAKDLTIALGAEADETIAAVEAANKLETQLREADKAVRQSTRGVGEYERGQNKIGAAISRVTNLQNIGARVINQFSRQIISLGVGFLSLEIGAKAIKSLVEYIAQLNIFNPVLTEAQIRTKSFSDAIQDGGFQKSITDVAELTENIKQAKNGFIDKDEVVNQYNATIGKTTGSLDDFNSVEQAIVKNGKSVIDITLKKAQAQALAGQIAKNTAETLEKNAKIQEDIDLARDKKVKIAGITIKEGSFADTQKRIARYEKDIAENNDRLKLLNARTFAVFDQITTDQLKASAKIGAISTGTGGSDGQQIQKQRAEAANSVLENQKLVDQQIIDNDKKSYDARIKATQDFRDKQLQILSNNNQVEANKPGLSPQEKSTIEQTYQNEVLSLNNETAKRVQAFRDQQLEAVKASYDKLAEKAKEAELQIYDNETTTDEQRIDAINKYYTKAIGIAQKSAEVQRKLVGNNSEKIRGINDEEAAKILQIKTTTGNQIKELDRKNTEEVKKGIEDLFNYEKISAENTIADLKSALDKQSELLDNQRNNEAAKIEDQYRKGKLSKQKYNRELQQLDDDYNVIKLANTLSTEKAALLILQGKEDYDVSLLKGHGASQAQIDEAKSKSGVSQQKVKVDTAQANLTKAIGTQDQHEASNSDEDYQEKLKRISAIIQDSESLTQDASKLAQAGYQKEIELLQQKSELITEIAKSEVDAVNSSIASAQTKQNQINAINARAAADQRILNEQIKQEKRKAAVAEKEANIAEIIQKTALAVIAQLSVPGAGWFLSAAVAAVGAAELATAIATPIPQFATGVRGFSGGLARFGEAGTEVVKEPGKKPYLTTGDTIGWLPKGTDIYSNMELMNMIRPSTNNFVGGERTGWRDLLDAYKSGQQNKQKRPIVNVNLNGSSYGLRR